jgi:uncharacterized protein YceH (UPF0502 family)
VVFRNEELDDLVITRSDVAILRLLLLYGGSSASFLRRA